jgi:Txe/YoeB family toxin of Txe-Axe toxin-antitoxin module
MVQLKVLSQNVSRSHLGTVRRGGNIAPLRIQVNFDKPNIIILTETCESQQFTGHKVFQGFELKQISRNIDRPRTGGVAIFMKKNEFECINESMRASIQGHYTIAVYISGGTKFILAAIYGPSTQSDNESYEIYSDIIQKIEELSRIYGTRYIYMGGDFNINMDKKRPAKPRTVRLVQQFIHEFDLLDVGQVGREVTWRRPHLPNSASRLDYSIVSINFIVGKFETRWGRFDHASIFTDVSFEHRKLGHYILKDWSLSSELFQEQAPKLIADILLDHDIRLRGAGGAERERFLDNRLPYEYENEIQVNEPKEGVTHSHILMIILEKLQKLQKKVQNNLKYQRKAKLERLSKSLSSLYSRIDSIHAEHPLYNEINEQINEIKNQIRTDTDSIEMANRMRISHFYESSSGKNVAASYYVCKDNKKGGGH